MSKPDKDQEYQNTMQKLHDAFCNGLDEKHNLADELTADRIADTNLEAGVETNSQLQFTKRVQAYFIDKFGKKRSMVDELIAERQADASLDERS